MNWLRSLAKWVADTGQSIQFVAFWAHFGMAALVVEHLSRTLPGLTLTAVVVLGGLKEFIFDADEETMPPQTFMDNFQDWLGWTAGAFTGYGFVVGWW